MKKESDRYYAALELLKSYRHTDEEQTVSLQSSLEIMRNHHKHGEMYYWLLYYSYLSPAPCENDRALLATLQPHDFGITKRSLNRHRRAAIYVFSECCYAVK